MDIKEIRELIQLIEKSAIEEFEMERSGVRIRVRKQLERSQTPAPAAPATSAAGSQELAAPEPESAENLHIFKSPIVGTFYLAPKPGAEPFVQVGSKIGIGTPLCIVEAMKIFNQIDSDVDGEIVRILVENGHAVEYGEPLFEILLAS